MIFTKNYFGKENIEDITFEDLEKYFSTERQESDKIEYKSFVAGKDVLQQPNLDKIIKTVTAFLNSDGGLLIWGAPEGKKVEGKKEKIFQGELSLVDYLFEKDQLISKISDSITPIPRGILFHRIEQQNKYAYILEVAKSEYSPHQFGDRFFMRIDGQSKPAPYHYIEALFKQIKFPRIEGYIKIDNYVSNANKGMLYISVFIFNLSPLQNDYNLSYRIVCDKGAFDNWQYQSHDPRVTFDMNGHEKRIFNAKDILHYGEPFQMQERIGFDLAELEKTHFQVTLLLVFGAKQSPMKMSTYKIKFSDNRPDNYNTWIIEKNENKFMGEGVDKTEDAKIKEILGRQPFLL